MKLLTCMACGKKFMHTRITTCRYCKSTHVVNATDYNKSGVKTIHDLFELVNKKR